jgi:uncharacterized protein
MTQAYDFEGTGDWPEYKALAETAMALAIAEQREVVIKWNNWVKPYNNYGEVVPVQYFKLNPSMRSTHIRGQYLNIQVKQEATPPPTKPVSTEQQKVYHTWIKVEHWLRNIVKQMQDDEWIPDHIVGVSRGGLVPAVMLSQYLKVPLHTLNVSFRDNPGTRAISAVLPKDMGHNILIVDDINDSGETLNYINVINWDLRGDAVPRMIKYAVLLNKLSSSFPLVEYSGVKLFDYGREWCGDSDNDWHVFPWEDWHLGENK